MASSSSQAITVESFRLRVEKVFGALASSSSSSQEPSSSLQSTLCRSLTDNEVDRRHWTRDSINFGADEIPSSSSFYDFRKDRPGNSQRQDLDELQGDDDYDTSNLVCSSRGGMSSDDADEWNIRSSIGSDDALDDEEEEDEYDNEALGTENDKDQGADHHMTAQIRLQEHEVEAKTLNSPLDCDDIESKKPPPYQEGGSQLKSILKKKGSSTSDSMSCKRVRFDLGCKFDDDHMSSHKRYVSIFKPVTFIPRNKMSQLKAAILKAVMDSRKVEQDDEGDDHDDGNQSFHSSCLPAAGIVAGELNESEDGSEEENEPESNAVVSSIASQKADCKYQTKPSSDE